ncbi:hypothetical protein PG991_013390 [Apiospora marii]|uniref:Uncharacterized protein n=1 Tax=Apiospora marii TaxID=335849 RepID=A0ABR1R632_9PEZI
MSTFPLARLIPELQDMVWKEVFNNEAQDRIALVHRDSLRVIPSKFMISPLKAVSRAVREVALKHYNVRLDVIEPTLNMSILDSETWYSRDDHYFVRAGHITSMPRDWQNYVRQTTHQAMWEALQAGRDDARDTPKGCIYLSSRSDKFLLSFTRHPGGKASLSPTFSYPLVMSGPDDCCVMALANARIAEILGPAALKKPLASQRYVSAKLPPSALPLIANVVYASPPYDNNLKPWPRKLYYPSTTVEILWMARTFLRMRSPASAVTYRTLEDLKHTDCDDDKVDALVHWILKEGPKSLTFREWQIEAHPRDPNGWRIWKPVGT